MQRILLALALSLFLSACGGPSPEEAWEAYQAAKAAVDEASDAVDEASDTIYITDEAMRKAHDAWLVALQWRNRSREDFQAWKAAEAEFEAAGAAYLAALAERTTAQEALIAAQDAQREAQEAWHEAEE